jgi:hypothetical protein
MIDDMSIRRSSVSILGLVPLSVLQFPAPTMLDRVNLSLGIVRRAEAAGRTAEEFDALAFRSAAEAFRSIAGDARAFLRANPTSERPWLIAPWPTLELAAEQLGTVIAFGNAARETAAE